jgi:hypothetical protein
MEADTLIGQTIHTNLVIKSKLGEGGMGTVYLAENAALREKKYAVKVLRRELTNKPGFRERFYEEARQQAQLDHPNIVQMYDYFNFGDEYFLILEFVEGKSLADLIDDTKGPLPEKRALSIIHEVLDGLNCAHEKGILHRDVKPSNVMLDDRGRARLTDFGIARQLGTGGSRNARGSTLGTPEYMSPEQIRDPDAADHRSDGYAAGIVLFEMLTGTLPFSGQDVLQQQLDTPAPDPRTRNPAIRKKLAGIVSKSMRKSPDERFQGCLEFRKAIDAYVQPKARLWALAAGLVLAAGAGGFYYFKTLPEAVQAVHAHARSAATTYALLCQQAKTLKMKQAGVRLAKESGNSGLADDFARQLDEINANLDDFAANYVRQLSSLRQYRPGTVQRALSEQPADAQVAGRAHYWQLAVRDYGRLAAGQPSPDAQAMIGDCAP